MIDYVIKILDITAFRIALRNEISSYAYLDDQYNPKHNLPITGVIPSMDNVTVAICRLDSEQYVWLMSLPHVKELGSGNPYIKEMSDITWVESGKEAYHAIYDQSPYDVDGETVTPPLLHCVLAS